MMKNTNIKNPDEEQDQSFTFSNQQFVSDSKEEDDGAYIEISLDAIIPGRDKDDAFLFRLSFSNCMLPRNSDSDESFRDKFLMHDVSVKSTGSAQTYTCSFDSSSMSSSCSSSSSAAVLDRSNARRNHSGGMVFETPALANSSEIRSAEQGNKWRKAVQLLAAQRFVNLLMLSLKSLPERYDPMTTSELPDENCWKVDKRKRTKVREAISSGLMKLIIKFRAIKTKSKTSLTNLISAGPEHITYGHSTERLSYSCYESPVKPFTERERKKNNGRRLNQVSMINSIKGVIDSVTVSCPGSIKSSPIHRNYCATEIIKTYTRENSIQAAIAHCKMSWELASQS
ncbi:unnamed protein product [Rhodiola kirilowii]